MQGPSATPRRRAGSAPRSLKARAIQWLAQREHSRSELRGKLLTAQRALLRGQAAASRAGHPDAFYQDFSRHEPIDEPCSDPIDDEAVAQVVDALLDWLAAHGHLSEARFVESRVHARQARYGNLRIRQELQQHGVALDTEAQAALKASELQRAREVWLRKFGSEPPAEASQRARQMRFLAGRGFSTEVIRRVIRGGVEVDPDPD